MTLLVQIDSMFNYQLLEHSKAVGSAIAGPIHGSENDFGGFSPAKPLLTHSPMGPWLTALTGRPVVSFPPCMGSFPDCMPRCFWPSPQLVQCTVC